MFMCGRSFGELSLDDKTVLGGVDITLHQAKSNFDLLRIAFADRHIAHLELVTDAHEHDGAVFQGLQCAGFDNKICGLCAQKHAASDEKSRPQTQIAIGDDATGKSALCIAAADGRQVGNLRLNGRTAILCVDNDWVAKSNAWKVAAID